MKTTFTPAYVRSNRGCYELDEVKALSFMGQKVITLSDILHSEIRLKDKAWFVMTKCELTLAEQRSISCDLAELVLPIFERRFPDDKRPRLAIEAARSGSMSGARAAADAAAYAAYDAAYAAYAYAAYAAAYAAAAAAYAAAYADAAYAYDAAAAAADADGYQQIILDYFLSLANVPAA